LISCTSALMAPKSFPIWSNSRTSSRNFDVLNSSHVQKFCDNLHEAFSNSIISVINLSTVCALRSAAWHTNVNRPNQCFVDSCRLQPEFYTGVGFPESEALLLAKSSAGIVSKFSTVSCCGFALQSHTESVTRFHLKSSRFNTCCHAFDYSNLRRTALSVAFSCPGSRQHRGITILKFTIMISNTTTSTTGTRDSVCHGSHI
jgi:hypothetical protein